MTEEERKLIDELFNRLVALENSPRDPAAEQAIYDGFQQAPNAAYALVQTVLIQDEALKRADARIRALEEAQGTETPRDSAFLGSMRQSLGLGEEKRAGSVPSIKPGLSSAWRNTGTPAAPAGEPQQYQAPAAPATMAAPAPGAGGSSFLGTAAAAAAGLVGGSLLMGGLRSMMGAGHAHAAFDPSAGAPRPAAPWSGSGDGGNLSRQIGLDDMGKTPGARGDDTSRAGVLGSGAESGGNPESADDQGESADSGYEDTELSGDDADFADDSADFDSDSGSDDSGE